MTARVIDFQAARAARQPEPWVSKATVARHFGVTPRTVDRWRKAGMPWMRRYPNSPVKFKLSEVERWYREGAA